MMVILYDWFTIAITIILVFIPSRYSSDTTSSGSFGLISSRFSSFPVTLLEKRGTDETLVGTGGTSADEGVPGFG